ncbi:hypothetical protein FOVSG1_002882 [Fusarium oxysporum f. sp. vasinfectum]
MKFCHHLSLGQLNEKSGRKLLSIFPPTSRRFSLRNLSKISQDEAIHSFQKTHALAIRSPVRIVLESRHVPPAVSPMISSSSSQYALFLPQGYHLLAQSKAFSKAIQETLSLYCEL